MKTSALLMTGFVAVAACRAEPDAPLVGAARNGRVDAMRALLAAGAEVDRRYAAGNQWTPLVHAIHKSQEAAVRALLEAGADPNARTSGGATPLARAPDLKISPGPWIQTARWFGTSSGCPEAFSLLEGRARP